MNMIGILEVLKWLDIDLLKFDKDKVTPVFDDYENRTKYDKYLTWNIYEGFKKFNSTTEYEEFLKSDNSQFDDVDEIFVYYDKETDCAIFEIRCWHDFELYNNICAVTSVQYLADNGITVLKEESE